MLVSSVGRKFLKKIKKFRNSGEKERRMEEKKHFPETLSTQKLHFRAKAEN
jgi:hypothetical protein